MKRVFWMICLSVVFLSGCGQVTERGNQQAEVGEPEAEIETETEPWNNLDEDSMQVNNIRERFKDPLTREGSLFYTIEQCRVYQNINQCELKSEDFYHPCNVYYPDAVEKEYTQVSDCIKEDGSIEEKHQLVLLDITVENEDAVGPIKKNEFTIYNISLVGGNPNNNYYAVYFSEAGKTGDSEQPFYFEIEQGQERNLQLGFFVLKEDLDKKEVKGLIGAELIDLEL